ncbi:MAG: signal peptide peptidase SppA [Candidatus Pacearchaeota archaeon]|nr:MAG: signal peptide peptidase SppA [Candidatus Pacearchaeota archaeon]
MKRGRGKGRNIVIGIIIAVIALVVIVVLFAGKGDFGKNVALIPVEGTITTTGGFNFMLQRAASSDEIVSYIEDATKDSKIKAIIFEINSPGGSAVASSEIAEAIKKARQEKLTIALIREQGTSGAYWVASACDHIIAHPLSFTGSIGVIASYLEISGMLERYNVTYEKLTSGEHKDVMSPFRELTDEEREMILKKLDIIYEDFVKEVAQNRGMTEEQVRELADGMFYLGKEAKDLGLVDQLGTKEEAINYIEEQLEIKVNIKEYQREIGLFDLLFSMQSQNSYWFGKGMGASLIDKNSNLYVTS